MVSIQKNPYFLTVLLSIPYNKLPWLVLRALDTNRRLKSKSRGPGGRIQSWIPLYIWGITPYILSCGVRQFLESESDISDWLELQKFIQKTLSTTTIATWFHLMLLLVLFGLLYIFVGLIVNGRYLCTFWLGTIHILRKHF